MNSRWRRRSSSFSITLTSVPSERHSEMHIPIITIENGSADSSASDCSAVMPEASSSPDSELTQIREAAMTPDAEAQKMRVIRGGFGSPLWAIMSITKAPESALVMKKIDTSTTAMPDSSAPAGSWLKVSNSAVFGSMSPVPPVKSTPSRTALYSAVPPMIVNHRNVSAVGTSSTPVMNSRTVRPLEMRAMNTPTKGDQEIHQPQ